MAKNNCELYQHIDNTNKAKSWSKSNLTPKWSSKNHPLTPKRSKVTRYAFSALKVALYKPCHSDAKWVSWRNSLSVPILMVKFCLADTTLFYCLFNFVTLVANSISVWKLYQRDQHRAIKLTWLDKFVFLEGSRPKLIPQTKKNQHFRSVLCEQFRMCGYIMSRKAEPSMVKYWPLIRVQIFFEILYKEVG